MESLRKWFYKPKRDDKSLLAQFFFADEDLNLIASELDSFDGRRDPERCTTLVNLLRQSQDRVLTITNAIMDVLIPNERANRDFRVKFPEDVLQENLAGQLWFGAECLAAGSSIMNREAESAAMRPLAKALTKSLENVRNLLREACLRNNTPNGPLRLPNNEFISESLKIFDKIFAEFELRYVSAMVPVKTTQEYELQELIGVLFSETLQRALKMNLLTQEQVDDYDPALMFTIPRLAIVSGLLIFPNGPLCIDKSEEHMSEMFRPFKTLLHKIRELLWTLNKRELYMLEKLLCDNEQINNCDYKSVVTNNNVDDDLDEFVNRFYSDYPLAKDFVSSFYTVTNASSNSTTDYAREAAELNVPEPSNESLYPDYETISDSSLPPDLEHVEYSSIPTTPLEDIITNVIETVTSVMASSSETPAENWNHQSENIEIPTSSNSGYLLSNTVEHDNILASLSNPDQQSPQRGESLPDCDCLETISAATATLSTLLTNQDEPVLAKSDEVKEDCLYCEEIKDNKRIGCIKNDLLYLESPGGIDSGISTENTSLDRSPSLDLVTTTNKSSTTSSSVVTTTNTMTSCQFNSNGHHHSSTISPVKNIEISYTEKKSIQNNDENCVPPSTSKTVQRRRDISPRYRKRHPRHHRHRQVNGDEQIKETLNIPEPPPVTSVTATVTTTTTPSSQDNLSVCSSETSTFDSDCADDEEIALAMQAAEIANRNEVRSKFRSTEDLLHRLFVCIAGVADQLQTNYASDLRNILKAVFLMNVNNSNNNNYEDTTTTSPSNENGQMSESIEYRASESDIIPSDEFAIDPNILAQEALFDTNVYFHIDEPGHQQPSEDNSQHEDDIQSGNPTIQVTSSSQTTTPSEDRPPVWIPDVQAPKCMSCEANFTVVKRRHHCRNCGKVFCARCSANSVPLPKYGHHKPVRVCNKCFMYHLTPFTM